jgi:hypothetical protein
MFSIFITKKKFKLFYDSEVFMAIFINLFFLFLIFLFCDIKYEVSDDFVMANILSGAYNGEPNPQMIFVNVIVGYILIPFYKMFPQISWYFIFQIFIIFISSVSITYYLLKVVDKPKAIMLSIIFILLFTNDAYILIQFTKTAMFAVMSGSIVFLNELFEEQKIVKLLFGAILCLIGTMLRFTTIYLAGGFLIFILIYEFLRLLKMNNINKLKHILPKIILCGTILIIFALGLKWVDRYTYNNDDEYSFFNSFNNARSHIVDYKDYGYENYSNELSSIGVSENDYYMIMTWGFADNSVFTIEKMDKIADIIKNNYDDREISFEKILEDVQQRDMQKYPVFLACVLLLILCIFLNYKQWWTMFISIVIGISLFIYFAYRERSLYRIEFSIFLGIFLCGIYFWKFNNTIDKEFILSSKAVIRICCIVTSICFLWNGYIYIPDTTYTRISSTDRKEYINSTFNQSGNYNVNKYRRVVNRDKPPNGLLNEINSNKQNFYFLDFTTTIQTLYFEWTPWMSLPKRYYSNSLILSGVTTNFPDEVKILSENNVINPLRDLVNNNVYLVDNQYLEIKLNYLKEHYYPNARADLYKEVDGYQIWKIYKN